MSFTTNLLWQNDPRWATSTLGYGPQTIQQWGCLTTSLTMVLNGCGYNETPVTVSRKMTAIGAFNGSAINAYQIGAAFPAISLANLVDCASVPAPLAAIDADLAANKPVVVCVDQSPAPGIQDHWVLLYAKAGSDYLMLDPWDYSGDAPGKPNYLTQRYKNNGGAPDKEITQVIFFNISGISNLPAPAAPPVSVPATPSAPLPVANQPLPADSVVLTSTADGLALRGAPSVTGPLLRRFPLGETLKSLESRPATLAKIGVDGQWIDVQAAEGDQGFVAAWYVSSPAAPVQTAPSSAPSTSVNIATVQVAQDQLAFRSQPDIEDSDLIDRLALGTQLAVIDPQASQKIGVVNQWLMVKDASGRTGYVAAWYVSA